MGIYINYTLRAEGAEEAVRERLERVRARCLDLPLASVGEIRRLEPIYNPILFALLRSQGRALPAAVEARLRLVPVGTEHGSRCLPLSLMLGQELPPEERERYLAAPRRLVESRSHWTAADVAPMAARSPIPGAFTPEMVFGGNLPFEFASVVLRRGYLLSLDPGEGSETMSLALSTFDTEDGGSGGPPLWYGQSFTKTQYAKEFVPVHETVCRVLDIVGEEGLLLKASDTCGYYATRSWQEASERVNDELSLAELVGRMMGLMIGNAREEGATIQVLQDNASQAKPVDFSAALEREAASEAEAPPASEEGGSE